MTLCEKRNDFLRSLFYHLANISGNCGRNGKIIFAPFFTGKDKMAYRRQKLDFADNETGAWIPGLGDNKPRPRKFFCHLIICRCANYIAY